MAVFECNRCSSSEVTIRSGAECCSVCGGTLSLISGEVVDLAEIEAENFAAAETAYIEDDLIQCGERRRAVFASAFLLAIAALIVAGMAARSDAMGVCQQAHSFDTCFSTLNR